MGHFYRTATGALATMLSDSQWPVGFVDAPLLHDGTQPDHTTQYSLALQALNKSCAIYGVVTFSTTTVTNVKFSWAVADPDGLTSNYKLFTSTDSGATFTQVATGVYTSGIVDTTVAVNASCNAVKLELYASGDLSSAPSVGMYDLRVYNAGGEVVPTATATWPYPDAISGDKRPH